MGAAKDGTSAISGCIDEDDASRDAESPFGSLGELGRLLRSQRPHDVHT